MHCSVQYATAETFVLFHRRVARRLTSEQVVSVMDELYDNNIPSGSDGEGLESDDGETETDELDQLCTIVCLIAWCAQ